MNFVTNKLEYLVDEKDSGTRIDKFLTLNIPNYSRNHIQKLILKGNLSLHDAVLYNTSYNVKIGDKVTLTNVTNGFFQIIPKKIDLDIIYEDQDLIVLNKQKNLVVHPGNGLQADNTLVSGLVHYLGIENLSNLAGVTRPGIVHRLDKNTTGLMLIAKNNAAHKNLSEQIYEKKVIREYKALVWGNISTRNVQQISFPIARNKKQRDKMEINAKIGKYAVTNYEVIKIFPNLNISFIICRLETGRTHQIRVHFEYIKHPIIGDTKYFKNKKLYNAKLDSNSKLLMSNILSQMLHSYKISFEHPTTQKTMSFYKNIPDEFQQILNYCASVEPNKDQ